MSINLPTTKPTVYKRRSLTPIYTPAQAQQAANTSSQSSGKNNGGFWGGLGYLGEKVGLGVLALTEGIWDFTAGSLADWFGADDWADSQFANDWVNYNHADEWYDPGEGWKFAGDVINTVPYAVEKVYYGATQSLEGIHDYIVGGVASLVGADDFAKRMFDDDLGDYTYADRKYGVTDGWRKTVGDVAGGIGTSVPSIAANFIPVVGPAVGIAVAGLGAAGNATKEAYRETGELGGKEYGYGALVGGTEAVIEGVSGKLGAGAKGIKDIITDGASKSIFKIAAKETAETISKKAIVSGVFKEMGKQALSEGVEEAIAEIATPYWKRLTYDPGAANATPQEVWYAAFVGGMSGAIMSGGSSGISIATNYSSGNKAINDGKAETVLEKSRYFAEREAVNDTGLEVYKNIKEKYEALQKSLAETNGEYLRMEQKVALGELNHMNAVATTAPFVEYYAQKVVFDAAAQAERLNAIGIKDADGNVINITAEMLTEGVDLSLAQSKNKADHKKFSKQLRKALSSNSVLTTVATMEATGRLMMDAKTFAQAAEQGKTWISEYDFHRFVETSTAEEKARYGEEFGIENWDGLSYEAFQSTMAEYASSSRSSSLIKQQKRINAAKRVATENTEAMPKSADNMTDGAHKFVTEDGQSLGIIKEGKNYYIYDYASGNISFAQGKDDINKLLSDIQAQRGTGDIAAAVPVDTNVSSATDGKDFAVADDNIIDVEIDGELAQRIANSDKSKYAVIREYLIENFYGETFELSDSTKAIMDKSDAQHLSHKADSLKTAELSNLREVIEKAEYSHGANNPTHKKFDKFKYYAFKVRCGGETFNMLLNVGRSKYDSQYHIYDITKNGRVANQSSTDLARPVGYALKNNSSTNNIIPENEANVNKNSENIVEDKEKSVDDGKSDTKTSRVDSINPKKIHEYLRENVKGYKALSEPNQAMVRAIIRQGRTLGIPEADLLLYAKVATRSGVNIVFDKEAAYLGKDSKNGKDVYADGFYQRSQNRIVVNPEGKRSAERLLIHELTHAIFKTPSGTIILMNGVKNLSQDEKDRITENYSKLHKNSSGGEISLKIMDEQQAHYAEWALRDRAILEKLVSDKPKLKDMILDFFTKAKSDYAGEDKLDAAARKLYRQYKKLFDEFSARNADTNAVERTVRGKSDEREFAIAKSFSEQIDDVINGTHNPRFDIYVSETPAELVNLNFSEGPILMRNSKVKEILDKHPEMSEELLKQIPKAINDPLLIIKSKTHPTESVVLISDIMTTKGEVIIPIWVNQEGNYIDVDLGEVSLSTNFVASAYGRDIKSLLEYANKNEGFLYQSPQKERVRQLLARNGLQLSTPLKMSNSTIIISEKSEKSNSFSKKSSEKFSDRDFALPEDLEKYNEDIDYSDDVVSEVIRERAQEKASKSIEVKKVEVRNNSGKGYGDIKEPTQDTLTVSRGKLEKIKANYQGDRTFNLKDVQSALEGIEAWSGLPAPLRQELVGEIWRGYNMRRGRRGYELFTELTFDKLCATIHRENDFNFGWDETRKIEAQVAEALHHVVDSGKESVRSKMKAEVQAEVKHEMEKLQRSAAYWRVQYDDLGKRAKVIGNLTSAAQSMKNLKLGVFANASEYRSDIFKGTIERLSNIQWRGNVSVKSTRKIAADLLQWYSKDNPLLEYASEDNSGYFVEDIREKLEGIAGGEKAFTLSELRDLRDIMAHLTRLVKNYNKVFINNKYVEAAPLAQGFVNTADVNSAVGVGALNNLKLWYENNFGDPLSVVKWVDQYQENGFYTEMFHMLQRAGLDAQIAEMRTLEAYDKFMNAKENKGYEKRLAEVVDYNGKKMTRAQLMSLYMTSKREQAWAGLIINGYTYQDTNGKSVRVFGRAHGQNAKEIDLTQQVADMQKEIEALLSEKDKEYIKIVEAGFETAKQFKIDRDMQRYGYTNALEGYYYPIMRANTAKSIDTSMKGDIDRVSSASFNKDTVKGAMQELRISSVDTVFLRHIHAVTQYAYLSPSIETFNKLFNLDISGNKNKAVTVKTQTKDAWNHQGKNNTSGRHIGEEYFRKLIEDIQGIHTYDEAGKFIAKMRGNYATYALGANPKVWATQLSSALASTSILDYDCLLRSFKDAKDVDIYCELAELRNKDNSAAKAQGVVNKLGEVSDFLMKPIGVVDRFVISRLFIACQVQVQKNGGAKMGTEANKVKAGELLERVILETQQNSLATERSSAMRSSSEFMKSITMFSADAMKVVGRVIDGFGEVNTLDRRIKLLQKAQKDGATYLDETALGKTSTKADSAADKKISAGMTDAERYELLKDRYIENIPTAEELPDNVVKAVPEINSWADIDRYFGNKKRTLIHKIASEFGVFTHGEYKNADVDLSFKFSNNNFRETYSKQGKNYAQFAKLFSVFNDVIDSAVGIEVHNRNTKGYKTDPTLKNVYVLMSAFEDGDNIVPVKLEVKEFSDKKNSLYVAITLEGIKKAEVWKSGSSVEDVAHSSRSANISISRLFEKINPSDESFYKYIPDQFKGGKKTDSSRRTIAQEIEALKKQKKAAGKKLGRSVGALTTSALFMAIVAKAFRALYHKDRDKDDEEKARDFVIDFIGNFFGGLPIIKEIWGRVAEGYELDSPTYSMINDVLNSATGVFELVGKVARREATSQDIARGVRNLAYSVGQVIGMPTRNMYNIAYGIVGIDEAAAYKMDNVFYKKNCRNDLYKYIEDDNAQMIEFTMNLVLGESVGDGVSDTVKDELVGLLKDGRSVLPRNISSTITYQGEEYQLTDGQLSAVRSAYADQLGGLEALFSKANYKSLSGEDKERAVKYAYDLYYESALSSALGIEKGNSALVSGVVGAENMALLSVATRGLESDKDQDGKSVSGSKRKKVISAINSLGLSREKKLLLICAKGYSIQDGDIRGLSAANAKRVLLRYILSLRVSKDEKARLAVMCGFEVTKNGRIVAKSAFSA